jgi:hypothetical protein
VECHVIPVIPGKQFALPDCDLDWHESDRDYWNADQMEVDFLVDEPGCQPFKMLGVLYKEKERSQRKPMEH